MPKVNVNAFGVVNLKFDGFVKSPSAVLRFIFRHCGVRMGLTAQGLGKLELGLLTLCLRPYAFCLCLIPQDFRDLACGALYLAAPTFYEFIILVGLETACR